MQVRPSLPLDHVSDTHTRHLTDLPSPILLLTAHPDDECMFFAPSVLALRERGKEFRGLCLSVGEFAFFNT